MPDDTHLYQSIYPPTHHQLRIKVLTNLYHSNNPKLNIVLLCGGFWFFEFSAFVVFRWVGERRNPPLTVEFFMLLWGRWFYLNFDPNTEKKAFSTKAAFFFDILNSFCKSYRIQSILALSGSTSPKVDKYASLATLTPSFKLVSSE